MPPQAQVRVLRPGESVLLSDTIDKVQITLFRSIHPSSITVNTVSIAQRCLLTEQADSVTQKPEQQQQRQQEQQKGVEVREVEDTLVSHINNLTLSTESTPLPWESVEKLKTHTEHNNVITTNNNSNNNNNINFDRSTSGNKQEEQTDINYHNNSNKSKMESNVHEQGKKMHTAQIPFYDSYAVSVYNEEVISRGGMECDYVGIGRVMSECHGLRYISHAVITGKEIVNNGYCSYNTNLQQAKPQAATSLETEQWEEEERQEEEEQEEERNANVFAAGDTVEIDFDYLMNCKGILVGLTRYVNSEQETQEEHNDEQEHKQSKGKGKSEQVEQEYERNEETIYYLVRKPNSKEPLCLIPLHHHTNTLPTILALQLHPLHFASGETLWEVSALEESIAPCDVKHVVLALETIAHDLFNLHETTLHDKLRIITKSTKSCESEDHNKESSNLEHCCVINGKTIQIVMGNDLSENTESNVIDDDDNGVLQERENNGIVTERDHYTSNSYSQLTPQQKELYVQLKTQYNSEFVELLANVPPVTRTGRQQYNVGYACRSSNEMIEERLHDSIPKQLRKQIENNNNNNNNNNSSNCSNNKKDDNDNYKINNANRIRTKSINIIDNEDSVRNDSDSDQVNFDNDEDANGVNSDNINIHDSNDIADNYQKKKVDNDEEEEEENDHSSHNEILEEALRVAVPEYTRNTLVRYGNKAYNYGGDYHALAEHLVKHRVSYAHYLAEQQNKETSDINNNNNNNNSNNNITPYLFAPHGFFASSCQELLTLQRMSALQNDNMGDINRRPPLPPEFVTRKASTHETTMEKKRNSLAGHRKRKGKRSSSKSNKKKKNKHRGKSASLRRKSKGKKRSKSKSVSTKENEKSKSLGGGSSSRKRSSGKVEEGNSKSYVGSNADYNERKTSKKQAAKRKASHSPTRVADVV